MNTPPIPPGSEPYEQTEWRKTGGTRQKRQAVVIIHGIGEQRPMSTLRGFAECVLEGFMRDGRRICWSKPDALSDSLELRRLTAQAEVDRPVTDFHEFYWAYLMTGTVFRHVGTWFWALLWRRPRAIPARLRPIWLLAWAMVVVLVALIATAAGWWRGFASDHALVAALSITALAMIANGIVLGYIGDAARYLDAASGNIAVRHAIRAKGIELLRRIHAEGRYDRVVLVGHSLGSVIAYDLIRHQWAEHYNEGDAVSAQPALDQVERAGERLRDSGATTDRDAFRNAQAACWGEQRRRRNAWLITDLVTLGSPLAHATLLMADGPADFHLRCDERELPTCPPAPERFIEHGAAVTRYSYAWPPGNPSRSLNVGAPFACTRWTNLYFPGDLVGGPLRPVFGEGVRDAVVHPSRRWLGRLPLLPHVWYWNRPRCGVTDRPRDHAFTALIEALDLRFSDSAGRAQRLPIATGDGASAPSHARA